MNFKIGDKVVVIAGKDKGKEGTITKVLRNENKIVIEGVNVIEVSRKMMGSTNPQEATPGSIRFDLGQIKECNIIHGSDCPESAEREIAIYFTPDEICTPKATLSDDFIKSFGHVEQ